MIDLHCHILPAIDDGSPDIETSIAMARMAAADGVTHIVATPHFRYGERLTAEDLLGAAKKLAGHLAGAGIAVQLLAGADIGLTYELLAGMKRHDIPTINGSRYFLVELPDLLPPNLDNLFHSAMLEGFVPVITHPERNYSLLSFPQGIDGLKEAGALFQLTAMSITGDFGSRIRSFVHMLLKKGFAHFVASDAHNLRGRTPVLSKAYRVVSKTFSKDYADRLFYHNPAAVIENGELP